MNEDIVMIVVRKISSSSIGSNGDIEDKILAGTPCVVNIAAPPCSPLSSVQVNFDIVLVAIFIGGSERVVVSCSRGW